MEIGLYGLQLGGYVAWFITNWFINSRSFGLEIIIKHGWLEGER